MPITITHRTNTQPSQEQHAVAENENETYDHGKTELLVTQGKKSSILMEIFFSRIDDKLRSWE